MIGNISYLSDYEPYDGGYVSFGQGGGKITGKGIIKTGKLEFENVYFVKDLKYNLFSLSQICDNKNSVLFTDSKCIVLGRDFKLKDDSNVLLRTPRQHNMYSIDLNNIVPHKDLTCLVAKASTDEWIKREFSNARTPQPNGVAERRNMTLIEAARTMLADAKLPVTFWAEAVNTACYVQNRVLVNKSQNKTPYDLFNGTSSTNFSGTKDAASQDVKKDVSSLRYLGLPSWFHDAHFESSTSNAQDACNADALKSSENSNPTATLTNPPANHMETLTVESPIPTVSSPVPTACLDDSPEPSSDTRLISKRVTSQDDPPSLDNILNLSNRFEDILGVTTNTDDTNRVEADLVQTKTKSKEMEEQSFIATIHQKTDPALLQFCLFLCFLYQEEPKNISNALKDPNRIEAMQEELLQFKMFGIWLIVLKGIVAQRHTQEEGIDYEEVFAPVARIEAIRLFLAYASFMGFTANQMDVKSAFLYGTIDEQVYVMQPHGFQDPEFLARVYKVEKAMYELHQAPRAWYGTLSKYLLTNSFQRGTIDQFIRRHKGDFILVQVYSDVRSSNTPMDKENPWGKDRTDRKSTTGGCQILGRRLISWQCKKQTIVATSTTKTEYVAAASNCGQVLWIQNQLLDYGTVPLFDSMLVHQDEGSRTPTEPHHTPSLKEQQSSPTAPSSPSLPPATTKTIPTTEMASKIAAQDLEITSLKAKIKLLKDKDGGGVDPSGEDATIKGRSLETKEEADVEKSTKRGSNDTEELVNVLTSLDVASILTSRVQVVSVPPAAEVATISVPTGSCLVPTASLIFTIASVVTPYSRRKGKEKMVESDTPKKKKLQEQIDIARDTKIARIHTEKELQILIDGLDRNNEMISKYLQEYEQFAMDLSIEERIDMINELVKYQDHYAKTLVKETLNIRHATSYKEKELWVELKRLYEHDVKDQLWTHTQALMHDPVEWRLYDTCGVHHVITRDQEIFIDEFPLLVYFPTASEDRFPLLSERDAPAEEVCTADEVKELAEYINTPGWNRPAFCNNGDDDDEDCTIAVTPDFPITKSLIMKNEHLDTILETESDEFIKSSVENLVSIPSEFEDFSDIESECDMLDCDDSQTTNFSTFSNPLFDDSTSSDDESSHEEVIHEMSFKTYSNPLFDLDEEIISSEFNLIHNEDLDSTPKNDCFDTDSYLLESSLNRDTLMISSLKIDSLLVEFAGELIFFESIPPGVDEANCDLEKDIHLVERLLYDNSSPRRPEEFVSENANANIESFFPSPIPNEDSDSFMEEIDLFLTPDDPMQPSIEDDDYDSERDILIHEELLDDYSLSLPIIKSFYFDIP
nr:putative RNA-directed DNA polymerase [Tanacetum cinerariifolium]